MSDKTNEALAIADALCRYFEGLHKVGADGLIYPYLCPAGYWTQGYGTVIRPDGRRVAETDPPISTQTAEQWLAHELRCTYMLGVLRASPLLAAHPKRLGAITDFAYNLGVPRYRASTLRKRVNAGDWEGAIEQLQLWVRAGGRVLPGLVKRRRAEARFM